MLVPSESCEKPFGAGAADADLENIAGRPAIGDLGFADEAEAVLLELVGTDVGVLFDAIVPEEYGLVDLARDREAHLAAALARRTASSSATRSSRSPRSSPRLNPPPAPVQPATQR